MGRILDGLRKELQGESTRNIFGKVSYPKTKDASLLYLMARRHDADDRARQAEALAQATESAALKIISRYDPEVAAEFYTLIKELKDRYLL